MSLTPETGVKRKRESLEFGREDEPLSKRINNLHLNQLASSSNIPFNPLPHCSFQYPQQNPHNQHLDPQQLQQYQMLQQQQQLQQQQYIQQNVGHGQNSLPNDDCEMSEVSPVTQHPPPTNQVPFSATPSSSSDNSNDSSQTAHDNSPNYLMNNFHYLQINKVLNDLHLERMRRKNQEEIL